MSISIIIALTITIIFGIILSTIIVPAILTFITRFMS